MAEIFGVNLSVAEIFGVNLSVAEIFGVNLSKVSKPLHFGNVFGNANPVTTEPRRCKAISGVACKVP